MLRFAAFAAFGLLAGAALADDAGVSVDNGARIAIIGGCHDCHSVGYSESNGTVDPATALMGSPVGYQGPWGTSYAANLRITASNMSEDEWVDFLKTFKTAPPMPWFNVHAMSETETRSLYQYIKSLGEPGAPAPKDLPPGTAPTTPYIVFAPPVMPAG